MSKLKDVVQSLAPCSPILPYTHTTTTLIFEDILSSGKIKPKFCDVFSKDLIYLYYGRGDYKVKDFPGYFSATHAKPVTVVINPTAAPADCELSPFDTGAFLKGLFESILGVIPRDKKERYNYFNSNYELYVGGDMAARYVTLMYGSNSNYLFGKPVSNTLFPTCLGAQNCYRLATVTSHQQFDARCGSIEARTPTTIDFVASNIALVIIPEDAMILLSPELTRLGIHYVPYDDGPLRDASAYNAIICERLYKHYRHIGII
jgi:hypothetical protein